MKTDKTLQPGADARDEARNHTRGEGAVGLCSRCRHARALRSPRAHYLLCERSRVDSRLPRYPVLPVLACHAFSASTPGP